MWAPFLRIYNMFFLITQGEHTCWVYFGKLHELHVRSCLLSRDQSGQWNDITCHLFSCPQHTPSRPRIIPPLTPGHVPDSFSGQQLSFPAASVVFPLPHILTGQWTARRPLLPPADGHTCCRQCMQTIAPPCPPGSNLVFLNLTPSLCSTASSVHVGPTVCRLTRDVFSHWKNKQNVKEYIMFIVLNYTKYFTLTHLLNFELLQW